MWLGLKLTLIGYGSRRAWEKEISTKLPGQYIYMKTTLYGFTNLNRCNGFKKIDFLVCVFFYPSNSRGPSIHIATLIKFYNQFEVAVKMISSPWQQHLFLVLNFNQGSRNVSSTCHKIDSLYLNGWGVWLPKNKFQDV